MANIRDCIVEAACGAVSHTYTSPIGEYRSDVVYVVHLHPLMHALLGQSACISFVHSSWIRLPFLSGIHGSDGLTAQLVGCPGPRGGPLGRCLVRIASVECCPVVFRRRCVPSVRRGSRLPLHYRRATSASVVPYPTLP